MGEDAIYQPAQICQNRHTSILYALPFYTVAYGKGICAKYKMLLENNPEKPNSSLMSSTSYSGWLNVNRILQPTWAT